MNYKISQEKGKTKIDFTLTKEQWDSFLEKAYQKEKGKINIAGFRKGHAPRHLIERLYGKSIFFDEAFNICFKDCFNKVLNENESLYPVEEPNINIETIEGEEIKFSASFDVKPEAELGQYKGLSIEKVEHKVAKKDIDAEIEKARERLSRKVEKDGEIENGDIINLDYSGSIDSVKFDGGTAQNQELIIGSHTFIEGFEERLVGMKKGDIKDISVKFPDNYSAENLKGKDAIFNVKINNIFKKELPELNDDFAKDLGKFETYEEYKKDLENNLKSNAEKREKTENEGNLVKKIVENAKVEIPNGMIQSELEYMLQDFSYQLMYMYNGMKLEDYFKYTGTTKESFFEQRKPEAENNVKTRLVFERIIKDENLAVTDEDYQNALKEEAEKAKKTVKEFEPTLDANSINYIKNSVLSKKLIDFLVSNNSFVKKTAKKA